MALHPIFSEFLRCLTENEVSFVVVGAFALAALGRPRATKDIDILVEPTADNARRLAGAFGAFGYPALAKESAEHFRHRERMATIGTPPLRIDVLSSITGVSFASAWAGSHRVEISPDGDLVPFLGPREFRRAKRASRRPQDLIDIALLDELDDDE